MHRTLAGLVAFLLAVCPAAAQEAPDAATIARIRAEGLERSQALPLYDHLTTAIGPRLAGTRAYHAAAEWARGTFERWGLANAHLEPFEFGRGWALEKLTLEMNEPWYFPLTGYPEAWSPSTRGSLSGTPVYIGDKTLEEIEAMGDRLRGAIVLPVPPRTEFITEDRPQPADTEERVRIGAPPTLRDGGVPYRTLAPVLARLGAAAVLRPNQGQHGTLFVLGRRGTADDDVPSVILAAEHYNLLVRLLASGQPVRVGVEVRARYEDNGGSDHNVIAEIRGTTSPDEVVLVGAHLDSWHSSPGATDNADGATAVMEAARILASLEARPRRTIRFALWGAEEQGLIGARAYASEHYGERNASAPAPERLYVYFNDDPGTGPTYGFYLEENTAVKPIFDAWLEPLRDLGVRRNVIDRIGSTDHLAFTALGLTAFNTLKDYTGYDVRTHHTNMDFYERVSEDDLKQSAIVLAVFAWQAANRPEPLPPSPPRERQ